MCRGETVCGFRPQGFRGFTLVELLVVIVIIAVLVGILIPVVSQAKQAAGKAACGSQLRQIGLALQMYRDQSAGRYPTARYMPPPLLSADTNRSLPDVLKEHLSGGEDVFHCPGDHDGMYDLCGSSYVYNTSLSGKTLGELWFVDAMALGSGSFPVSFDFDGDTYHLNGGGQISVGPFHMLRNLLFADGRVGNFQ